MRRREFLQAIAAAAAAGLPLSRALSQDLASGAAFYDAIKPFGNVSLLHFTDCHAQLLPSYYREGVPLSLIEGAAAGRALVTTDTPGCREIGRHGVNGLLVPPRVPSALAEALGALLGDPATRARMGAAGRALVEERFSSSVVNREILAHYLRLLDASPHETEEASVASEPAPPAAIPSRPAPVRRVSTR